jgi:hypothetical protein
MVATVSTIHPPPSYTLQQLVQSEILLHLLIYAPLSRILQLSSYKME